MFLELERRCFPFSVGNAEFYLRFDNKALLEIEKNGFDVFDFDAERLTVKAAKCFLTCGLRCYAEENRCEDIEDYAAELADRIIKAISPKDISAVIAGAVLTTMPEPIIGAKSGKNEKEALATAYNTKVFQHYSVLNGGNKSGFLQSKNKLSEPAMDALKEKWKLFRSNKNKEPTAHIILCGKLIDRANFLNPCYDLVCDRGRDHRAVCRFGKVSIGAGFHIGNNPP